MPRIRNEYSEDFKSQMIRLRESGKPRKEILKEYNLKDSTFDRWVKEFKEPSNRSNPEVKLSDEQKYIAELERKNRQLEMEVDILKQATLIIGKRSK